MKMAHKTKALVPVERAVPIEIGGGPAEGNIIIPHAAVLITAEAIFIFTQTAVIVFFRIS